MTNLPPNVMAAARRAATIRADPEMVDFRHSTLRRDVVTLMQFIESLPEPEPK